VARPTLRRGGGEAGFCGFETRGGQEEGEVPNSIPRSRDPSSMMSRMAKRGKVAAFWSVGIGTTVLIAAAVVAWPRLREEWYLYRLERGNTQQRLAAIRELESMPSLRAVPKLVAMLYREDLQPSGENSEVSMDGRAAVGLIKIGPPILPTLEQAAKAPGATANLRFHTANILSELPRSPETIAELQALALDANSKVSGAARLGLGQLPGPR
jgi:HEAT repeat protein